MSRAQNEFMKIIDSMISYEFRFQSLPLNFTQSFFLKQNKYMINLKTTLKMNLIYLQDTQELASLYKF